MLRISEIIAPEAILCGCRIHSRDELLGEMVRVAAKVHSWTNAEELTAMVIDRECKMSTGIGIGIAVPHARLETVDRIHVAVACVPAGVDFRSPDRNPVRLALLLVSPVAAACVHVKALAAVSRIAQTTVDRLVVSATPEDFLETLRGWERTLPG